MADEAGDDQEIKTFIRKVFANQATMFDITPKELGWKKEQSLR